ncbi:MAG: hypothetical protein Q8876_01110 [Bacillota bacterium]|nr:hypothetical protein [Bacillota bacterium]
MMFKYLIIIGVFLFVLISIDLFLLLATGILDKHRGKVRSVLQYIREEF